MEKPVIILSCDVDERDRMRMRQEYFEAVIEAGGVPVVMPPLMLRSQIDEWLDRIDAGALMLTGGCDIDPQTFREMPCADSDECRCSATSTSSVCSKPACCAACLCSEYAAGCKE